MVSDTLKGKGLNVHVSAHFFTLQHRCGGPSKNVCFSQSQNSSFNWICSLRMIRLSTWTMLPLWFFVLHLTLFFSLFVTLPFVQWPFQACCICSTVVQDTFHYFPFSFNFPVTGRRCPFSTSCSTAINLQSQNSFFKKLVRKSLPRLSNSICRDLYYKKLVSTNPLR